MRLPGQWFQLKTSLHYNWHRTYDPSTGRYLQPDPLGMPDGPGRYAYVRNSPLMKVDPRGLAEVDIPITPMPGPFIYAERLSKQKDPFHNFSPNLDRIIYEERSSLQLWYWGRRPPLSAILYGGRLPIDAAVSALSGKLEAEAIAAGHCPGMADALIAGTAKAHDLTVVTLNLRHFEPFGIDLMHAPV